jgi:hypothetical protein
VSGTTEVGSQTYASAVNAINRLGGSVNIPEMGLLVQMERHNILQTQVQDQFKDMQKRNEWLKVATDALNSLRSARQSGDKDPSIPLSKVDWPGLPKQNLEQFFWQNGIAYPPRWLNQADVDTCIANLKSSIDTVNTNSQLDMVRMQGLMDKLNQATDFMTNWISKNSKTMDSIVGNIR